MSYYWYQLEFCAEGSHDFVPMPAMHGSDLFGLFDRFYERMQSAMTAQIWIRNYESPGLFGYVEINQIVNDQASFNTTATQTKLDRHFGKKRHDQYAFICSDRNSDFTTLHVGIKGQNPSLIAGMYRIARRRITHTIYDDFQVSNEL